MIRKNAADPPQSRPPSPVATPAQPADHAQPEPAVKPPFLADAPAPAAAPAAPVHVRTHEKPLLEVVAGRRVVSFAEFDLDDDLRYARRGAALVDTKAARDNHAPADAALLFERDGHTCEVSLADVEKVDNDEALGVDRLTVVLRGGASVELPYSRKGRRDMNRLYQQLKSRAGQGDGIELAAPPDEEEKDQADFDEARPKVLLRLLEVAHPYRWKVRWALVLTLIGAFVSVLPQVITKYIIDTAINPETTVGLTAGERAYNLFYWSGLYTVAIAAMLLAFWGRLHLLSYVGSHVAGDLRRHVYRHMHTLSMRYFGKHRTGSLITRVTSDTDRLWDFIVFGSVDFIRHVALMVVAAGFMFYFNWRLALIGLAPVPLVAVVTWWKTRTMTRLFSRLWTYWSRLTATVGDALPGVKVVKAFAAEGREVDRFNRRNDAFTADEYGAIKVWVSMQPVVEGTMMISRIVILLAGGYFIIDATRSGVGNQTADTIGTLVMFLGIVGFFHMAINELAMKQRMVTRAATSAQRVFEVLDTKPEITSKPGALAPERMDGRVEFRNVSFSYDGTKPVLRNVSLTVEPGNMIGLCGHSGAGKSTFVNLVSRFFDVSDGAILIDGQDVRDYDLNWLRSRVGVVLQEPYLFHGTVADNIRYGRPDASLKEVIAAAKAANAHDFVVGLPDGYDTMVGERGQSLSGGERQRVSIARAILHNPRILILDEATSSVDTKTEKQIQEALDRLVEGRTVFAIAHRLSTLRDADQIVVLDKGSVVETGTHSELLAKGQEGHYGKLFQAQAEVAANMIHE